MPRTTHRESGERKEAPKGKGGREDLEKTKGVRVEKSGSFGCIHIAGPSPNKFSCRRGIDLESQVRDGKKQAEITGSVHLGRGGTSGGFKHLKGGTIKESAEHEGRETERIARIPLPIPSASGKTSLIFDLIFHGNQLELVKQKGGVKRLEGHKERDSGCLL